MRDGEADGERADVGLRELAPWRNTDRSRSAIASFASYEDAQRAVDALADRRFPVDQVAIVARDLRFVEQITGRRSYGKAALDGAVAGAATGTLLGFFVGLWSLVAPFTSAIALASWGLVVGAIVGAVVGVIGYAVSSGRRDFHSVRALAAGRYDVVVAPPVVEPARRVLEELHSGRAA
jgi:hypothetical protein